MSIRVLPELLDARKIMGETGVKKASAEAMMRKLPTVQIPGLRKVFVKRVDLLALIEQHTYTKEQVPS